MAETTTSHPTVGFSDKQRNMITIGSVLMMIYVAAAGLSLNTIQGPMLEHIGAGDMFSLITIVASIALCVMTPIGGRLYDIYGLKKIVLYSSVTCIIANLLLPFMGNAILFLIVRFILSIAMGGFVSAPYLLAHQANKPQDVPKVMGYLTAALAIGSLAGSYLAGFFSDHGQLTMGVIFPVVFLIISTIMIIPALPNQEKSKTITLDIKGTILLTLCLFFIFLSLNFGPALGFGNPLVLIGLVLGIIFLVLLVVVEKKEKSALIPMQIFKNKEYNVLLWITFFSVFYMISMNTFMPQAIQEILGKTAAESGIVQLPRSIISVILPTFVGVWLTKKTGQRTVISLIITGICIAVCFAFLIFVGVHMPLWFIILCLSLTGIADSFRSVCVMPAAQSLLKPSDMGVGTALVGFIISLSNVIAASIDGIAYDSLRLGTPGIEGLTAGVDTVFLISCISGILVIILTIFVYKPMVSRKEKKAQAAK